MKPYYADPLVTLYLGDCLEVMPGLEAESVDAVVTDPPYGLGFMGKHWDHGVPAREFWAEMYRVAKPGAYLLAFGGTRTVHRIATNIEDAGWIIRDMLMWIYASGFPKGKANLKPAHEPIVLARKPGPLRPLAIDECRIPSTEPWAVQAASDFAGDGGWGDTPRESHPSGRWPSNVLLSDPELFDEPNPWVVGSGAVMGPSAPASGPTWEGPSGSPSRSPFKGTDRDPQFYGDSGGYSRFFIVPKADRQERERGLSHTHRWVSPDPVQGELCAICGVLKIDVGRRANHHPTVKPIDLMRHLVRLVTPPGGVVLDPFLGSGTTALAASEEGFRCIGIEREPEYLEIAVGRLMATPMGLGLDSPIATPPNSQRARPDSKQVKWKPGRAEPAEGSSWFHGDEEPAA